MKRLLVTTALEETWKDDVPVLFLGEWCCAYNRRHIWSKMDALVAQPFGVEPEKKLSDTDYVDELAIKILSELTESLNEFHQVQHNERYWNIVLGHWLKRYVSVAFNRYYTIDQALKNHEVSGSVVLKDSGYGLATPDSWSFILGCNDDNWNHAFYSRVLAYREDVELDQVLPTKELGEGFAYEKINSYEMSLQTTGLVKKLLNAVAFHGVGNVVSRLAGTIGTKFSRDTDAFFISSYLPVQLEIKLQLALGQVPQLWRCPLLEEVKADLWQRENLKLSFDSFDGFERYVRWQLPEVVPTCYLEGYKNMVKAAEGMAWPKKPKFIFTSNAFDTEEIFKVWTASKVENGVPYIVGQHGCSYGTHAWEASWCWPERAACDKFVTWGWTDCETDFPAFAFLTAEREPQQFDKAGGLLLVECCKFGSVYNYDPYYEFILYMEEQFRFVENLPEHIHQELTVRLHTPHKEYRCFEEQRWSDRSSHTKIEGGVLNIRKLISQSRLIVYSYDSTGILEALALNNPMICFWRNGLHHIVPTAKPYFELLNKVGILHYSPETAAKFVDLHWDGISEWWESEEVQDARQIFCEQYARTVDHPVQELKNILTNNL